MFASTIMLLTTLFHIDKELNSTKKKSWLAANLANTNMHFKSMPLSVRLQGLKKHHP